MPANRRIHLPVWKGWPESILVGNRVYDYTKGASFSVNVYVLYSKYAQGTAGLIVTPAVGVLIVVCFVVRYFMSIIVLHSS